MSALSSAHCFPRLLSDVSKQIPSLRNEDRVSRKEALISIRTELLMYKKNISVLSLEQIFLSCYSDILLCFRDPVEKCRETAADIMLFLLRDINTVDESSSAAIIATLLHCLASPDEREFSEVVRDLEVEVLLRLINMLESKLLKHMNDIVLILEKCIVDVCPEIKRKSCNGAADIAYCFRGHIREISGSLINPLLQTITHQHWKVRTSCVIAIGAVIQYGNNAYLNDVLGHLAQRVFDNMAAVRGGVVHVVGTWLVELPDRFSYFPRILPILLAMLSDEVPQIRDQAKKYWIKAGEVYLEDNEKDYKDEMDFPKDIPKDYPIERASLGCRVLVQRYTYTILPALLNDMNNWLADTRLKSVQLLYILVQHCEEKVTLKLQSFLQCIMMAAADEESQAIDKAIETAELLAYFTDTKLWSDHVLAVVLEKSAAYPLAILAALLRGARTRSFPEAFDNICDTLASSHVCRTTEPEKQANLLLCVEALVLSANEVNNERSYKLFCILSSIAGLASDDCLERKVDEVLALLSSVQQLSSKEQLFKSHALKLMKEITVNHELWTENNPEVMIFKYLVQKAILVEDVLEFVMHVIVVNLKVDKSPKLRCKFLQLISFIVHQPKQLPVSSIFKLLHTGILPNLAWSAGHTAATIRTIAAAILWEIIKEDKVDPESLSSMGEELLSCLNSLADDQIPGNRLLACKVLGHLLPNFRFDEHCIHKTSLEFLRCLDDELDDVRIASLRMFRAYFSCFPPGYDWASYSSYLQSIYQTILIHMDDKMAAIRHEVFKLLKEIAFASPEILLNEVADVRSFMDATELCDQLVKHIRNLKMNG